MNINLKNYKFVFIIFTLFTIGLVTTSIADAASPTIKITKDTTDGDGSFNFTIFNATNPANSTALNIPDTFLDNMTTPLSVQTGSYSVIETVPLNWNLISSDCLVNGIPQGSTLNFAIIDDDTVECIFENTFVPPAGFASIKITKDTTDGDGSFNFTIFNATNPANSTALNIPDTSINDMTRSLVVQTGSYSVIETVPLNWNLITSDCLVNGIPQGSTLNFAIIDGDTVECIFENTFTPPPCIDGFIPTDSSFPDNEFTLCDDIDNTKNAQFELSNITSGMMRILTLPDLDGTIALLSDLAVPANLPSSIAYENEPNIFTENQTINANFIVDTTTFFVDSINNIVGIGTSTPSGAILDVTQVGGGSTEIQSTRYNENFGAGVVVRKAGGTESMPIAIIDGKTIGYYGVRGHDGTEFTDRNNAVIRFQADGNWSPTSHGTKMDIGLTPNASLTRSSVMTFTTDEIHSRVQFVLDDYIQLDTSSGIPPATDCDNADEVGRMKVDSTAASSSLYVCTPSGWATFTP